MSDAPRAATFWPTAGGALAILIWSTSVGVNKSQMTAIGSLTGGTGTYAVAGLAAIIWLAARPSARRGLRGLTLKYWLGCGLIFVVYSVCLNRAIGLSADEQQTLEAGLINYLWPATTILFSIPLLGTRARWFLWPGVLIALAGIWLACSAAAPKDGGGVDMYAAWGRISGNSLPYIMALGAAVTWGLYSNLCRKWGGEGEGDGLAVFLMATALALGAMRMFTPEESAWTGRAAAETVFLGLAPGIVAYILWEAAMRRGRMMFVASLSYFTPVLSTAVTCAYLGVSPGWNLWAGAGLTAAGAVMCKMGAKEKDARGEAEAGNV
jgi:drug/metabolite transporter (DMT)-like permease